jgi:hypothetical protein
MSGAHVRHLLALTIGAYLIFGLRLQDINIQGVIGPVDQRHFEDYTPYFPGLTKLETHEIFAPEYASTKKIVLLGASSVDSIGCDYTWHKPPPGLEPNVHYSCSIAGQMNELLQRRGLTNWRAFDLARNGGKMTPTLYIYSRIKVLKPDIVVMGDSYNYYMWENADADALAPEQYAYLDKTFSASSKSAQLWSSYKANLERHGWTPTDPNTHPAGDPDLSARPRPATSAFDLAVRGLSVLRARHIAEGGKRPIALTSLKGPGQSVPPHHYENPDPDFAYFQGAAIVGNEQKSMGKRMLFYFSPQMQFVDDPSTINGIDVAFGGYMREQGVPFLSLISTRMKLGEETYDGSHQTVYGNRRIAEILVDELQKNHSLPGNDK